MDIHNYKKRLECTLRNIRASELSEKNKETILDFHDACFAQGLSVCKTERYLFDVFRFTKMLDKDLKEATRKDIQRVVIEVEKKEWSPHSKHTFKVMIKKLYKIIKGIDEKGVYPEEVGWIRSTVKNSQQKLPEELMTEEEVKKMVQCANTERNRAFIALLYESGCRVGEVGSLKIKDVAFDEYGAKVNVFGKTGSRRIRIINSAPYLRSWINNHPHNDDPDWYLWTVPKKNKALTYTRLNEILKSTARKAGIKKKIYPHLFRHSRATFLANHLTEAQMKNHLGWTQSSKMAAVYVHLSGRDTEAAILSMNGIEISKEGTKPQVLNIQTCEQCQTKNEAINKYCKLCGNILDKQEQQRILQQENDNDRKNEIMKTLLKDPEVMELIKDKLAS